MYCFTKTYIDICFIKINKISEMTKENFYSEQKTRFLAYYKDLKLNLSSHEAINQIAIENNISFSTVNQILFNKKYRCKSIAD